MINLLGKDSCIKLEDFYTKEILKTVGEMVELTLNFLKITKLNAYMMEKLRMVKLKVKEVMII